MKRKVFMATFSHQGANERAESNLRRLYEFLGGGEGEGGGEVAGNKNI